MVWVAIAVLASTGGLLWWSGSRKLNSRPPLREAAPGRSVSELSEGRFRIVGWVVPIQSLPSAVDGAACVFLETADYRTFVSEFLPILREVERRSIELPFLVDDGTGRIWIDPQRSVIDTHLVRADQGLTAERRLVAGEEVEVVANFAPRAASPSEEGPYRRLGGLWEAVNVGEGPPMVAPRLPSAHSPSDEAVVLRRGLGLVMIAASVAFGMAASFSI